jgi:3-methyladenine DNA glycosylase AlkD
LARTKQAPSKTPRGIKSPSKPKLSKSARQSPPDAEAALAALKKLSTQRDRDNLARFGIMDAKTADKKAFGVSMRNIQALAKKLGRSRELAAALWASGVYEARMLSAFVEQPEAVTAAQMDRWCGDFDN